ncbi:hypothetical protein Tco_0714962 [Tanacetum coccineum]
MELYMLNRPHGRMILASVEKEPLIWPLITVDGAIRLKEYIELTPAEAIQADCDIKAINIILQGIPTEMWYFAHGITASITQEDKQLERDFPPIYVTFDESMEAIRRSLTKITQENHVPEVIALNEPKIPHTEVTESPSDPINTEGIHEQNVQNDQMITQLIDAPSGNNTESPRSITEPLVPDVTQSHTQIKPLQACLQECLAVKLLAASPRLTQVNMKISNSSSVKSPWFSKQLRPDIQFSTVLCARYQSNPKESYLTAVKRILKYLKEKALQRGSVVSPPLAPKPKKGKSQAVTPTLPKSQGHEASGALSKKRKKF